MEKDTLHGLLLPPHANFPYVISLVANADRNDS